MPTEELCQMRGEEPHSRAADADVEAARGGDRSAFERLYRAHAARVHGLARRLSGAGRADDLTQDVFLAAWRGLPRFEGRAGFGTWLVRLTLNRIASERRRAGRARSVETDAELEPLARPSTDDWRLDFEHAVERLPGGAREVFVLHDVEGWTHAEIAAWLEVDLGTSKSQLHRARLLLRAALQEPGDRS